ncbi:site-specific tyrosine recombinase XerC [Gemmata sp. SH-PL17]|uniref:tyrosine-type recombinase/integrase n=1 Tax=Gemmata sp. SH-PL17 TaxID=1630693 RepID=UPI00078B8049|nr:site-specific integrase [Gemmata sp. SH-PL17]AMV26211.1 site-specific tyrosine recombinase XerC [Gemmata sp. SH-PL17]
MPRQPSVPKLCHHKASGRAVVRLNSADHYLGVFGTPEAKDAYDRLIAEWLANGRKLARPAAPPALPTVDEVLLAFWHHAERYYRLPSGEPTSEIVAVRKSLRPVHELFGRVPATEFGPKALAAVRQQMIHADLCRNVINKRIDRVKRAFKWATAEELVPVSVYEALRTLAGLKRDRTEARESKRVLPVNPEHLSATLPHLDRHVSAMATLQRFTGMRPGEVCALKLAEVDRSGAVWVWRPDQHKTAWRDKDKVILFGPNAQAVVTAFLQGGNTLDHGEYLFSPRAAREERYAALRAARKSKVPPSQVNRRTARQKRAPGPRYWQTGYAHAIQRAAERAGVPHWHPNQIRHLFGTEVRKAHGLEAAQVLLGHERADVTQVYAERDLALAMRIAAEIG